MPIHPIFYILTMSFEWFVKFGHVYFKKINIVEFSGFQPFSFRDFIVNDNISCNLDGKIQNYWSLLFFFFCRWSIPLSLL